MIPLALLRSTFHARFGNDQGTIFTINYVTTQGKWQYLVTARHNIESMNNNIIDITYQGSWTSLPVNLIGYGNGIVDVAVLSSSITIGPTDSFPRLLTEGMSIGQQVNFLGFPLGMQGDSPDDHSFPFPLAKSGSLSGVDSWNSRNTLFIDGHVNRGFSGGPLIYHRADSPHGCIAGVVTHHTIDHVRLEIGDQSGDVRLGNAGIGTAVDIRHVVAIINSNPNRDDLFPNYHAQRILDL